MLNEGDTPPDLPPGTDTRADLQLVALVHAAESGELVARVRVIVGSILFVGRPTSTTTFVASNEAAARATQEHWELKQVSRKEREAATERATNIAARLVAPLKRAADQNQGEDAWATLTLEKAELWPLSGGDGLRLPAVRIPLPAIDAWWIDGASKIKASGGGGWFAGIAIPIGN
jgi:hypothetical protein